MQYYSKVPVGYPCELYSKKRIARQRSWIPISPGAVDQSNNVDQGGQDENLSAGHLLTCAAVAVDEI